MKRPKVILTDYRPPSAGGNSPVESVARPRAAASKEFPWQDYASGKAKESAAHDKAVDGFPRTVLEAIGKDLAGRHAWNDKDHEQRWIMGRLAAVGRKLAGMRGALA